jgi:nucleoside-diphosphate-sugar epimerase
MKTVAITGGMGFIGHHLAKFFIEKKWTVKIIDDLSLHVDPYLTKYRLESIQNKKCEFINTSCIYEYDVRNKLKDAGVDVIVHLASIPNQKTAMDMPQHAVSSIVGSTLSIANIAKTLHCKFVHISSSMAYGNFTRFPQKEDSPLSPINLYGLLKAQSEDIVKLTCQNYTIIRPSAVYGPGDSFDRVLAKWILLALDNHEIFVDDPSTILDFTHVTDLVRGIFDVATDTHHRNETYNITRGQGRSLGEAVLLIKDLTNSKSHVSYVPAKADHPIRGALDISKAHEHFGYQPRVNLQVGIESYINWVKTYQNVH